jgi:hypothetical protein
LQPFGSVVQLVRMPPCHGGGRGFESRPVRKNQGQTRSGSGFLVFTLFFTLSRIILTGYPYKTSPDLM